MKEEKIGYLEDFFLKKNTVPRPSLDLPNQIREVEWHTLKTSNLHRVIMMNIMNQQVLRSVLFMFSPLIMRLYSSKFSLLTLPFLQCLWEEWHKCLPLVVILCYACSQKGWHIFNILNFLVWVCSWYLHNWKTGRDMLPAASEQECLCFTLICLLGYY